MAQNPIDVIFAKARDLAASDIHIAADAPVLFRVDGTLMPQTEQPLTTEQAEQFVRTVLGETPYKRFERDREIDVSYSLKDGTRMRVNCAYERGTPTLVARIIATKIPTLDEVGLTELWAHFGNYREGLILFTGPTGSGKSTSLASLITMIQQQRPINLITLEDPIEFLFPVPQGCVRQRQYTHDFLSFAEGLKHVLRQDPDVVMVGEMRDPETIAAALTLAETGHLIFATLHTPNAVQTVDRIIDVFPPHQQSQVRSQLSLSLKAIVAQRLVAKTGGGRVAVREVLINSPAVGNIIRDNRAQELKSVLQTNESIGMCSYEKGAKRLYKEGKITKETFEFIIASQ
ncbi:PilT/PilU family type 4a pilus ATPase [Candidatus Peregrinibacteria bacterium]|nr:PilT/PilU family type 4a pilus ATPase [Candidatus Peregrinibacteria bacterium]MBI3816310.1 PilT/PilU family type 4a pilus ATPase [Candidatus Peregrinibacteria bacterium]